MCHDRQIKFGSHCFQASVIRMPIMAEQYASAFVFIFLAGSACIAYCTPDRPFHIRDTDRDRLRQYVLTRSATDAFAVIERKRHVTAAILEEFSAIRSTTIKEVALLHGILKTNIFMVNRSCLDFDETNPVLFDAFFDFFHETVPLLPGMLPDTSACQSPSILKVAAFLSDKLQGSFDLWNDFMDAAECDHAMQRRLATMLSTDHRALHIIRQALYDYRSTYPGTGI
ncbi:unnamed protein product (mitochondrion) [Plasmodiophora brassicae]|uniref:Uncharacterized protein n=2 Tax=Plasmodiophora brassicae TaxID=37360 RepID=A0A3P3Y1H3_PLABS|nr:unnamed protein product [Plasmodiophora brassicae]